MRLISLEDLDAQGIPYEPLPDEDGTVRWVLICMADVPPRPKGARGRNHPTRWPARGFAFNRSDAKALGGQPWCTRRV